MFCDQPHSYFLVEGGRGRVTERFQKERARERVNNLIGLQHVEQCRSEGRKGTLNLERDCEIVRPHPMFPGGGGMRRRGDVGREMWREAK